MTAEAQLTALIDRYAPAIAAAAKAGIDHLRQRLPGAMLLVYDNYNACGIGFSANDKASGVVLSLVLYPRWITLFFMRGIELPDPDRLLVGNGSRVRSVRLTGPGHLLDNGVDALIDAALALARPPIDPLASGGVIIKAISPKQRPRRP